MKRIEYISPEEFTKLYKAEKDEEMKLVLLLGFGAGMRISEIVGLKRKVCKCHKVEPNMVRELIENRRIKKYTCAVTGEVLAFKDMRYSGEGWEISPLTADRVDLVQHQIRIDEAKGQKWRITVTPPLLTSRHLNLLPIKIPMRTVQHRFLQLSLKALGKKTSVHILRHGFGNYQANIQKVSLPIIQGMMGHSRLDTTGIYTKANPSESIGLVWNAMVKE
jgi:integrase